MADTQREDDPHKTADLTGTDEGGTDMKSDAGEDDGGVETEGDGNVKDEQKPTSK